MKKVYIMIIVILLIFLLLNGCNKNQNCNFTENIIDNDEDIIYDESFKENDKSLENKDNLNLQMLVDWTGLLNTPMAASKYGCYEIMFNTDGSANILYTDIDTKQRIYLSSDISSEHNTEADTSWIKNANGGCLLFVFDDSLFLSHFGDSDEPGLLYRMDLDGRNKKQLLSYNNYEAISNSVTYSNDNIYTILTNKNEENILVCINLKTGDLKEIKNFNNESVFLMSAYDDYMIIKIIEFDTQSEDALKAYYNQKHIIYKYSIKDDTMTKIVEWKQDTVYDAYDNKFIYLLEKDTDSVTEINVNNGDKKIIIESLKANNLDFNYITDILPVYDNHIIIDMDDGNSSFRKYIDLDKSCINDAQELKNGSYLGIVGVYDNTFLVTTGRFEIPVNATAPDGSPIITMMGMRSLAIINKQDFWANKYDFQEIDNTFLD